MYLSSKAAFLTDSSSAWRGLGDFSVQLGMEGAVLVADAACWHWKVL